MTAPPTMPPGYSVAVFGEIDSTMDEARRRAEQGNQQPLWIVAERQTKGRGRRSRAWESGDGNLLCTLSLHLHHSLAEAAKLSFLAALCVAETLDHYVGDAQRIRLKWPNDVLLDDHKAAGILLESAKHDTATTWLSIGIGVNLAQHPQAALWPATSLRAAGVDAPHPHAALEVLARRFAVWLARWQTDGFAPIKAAWLARAARIGAEIEVRLDKDTLAGIFTTLDETGALVLTGPDGSVRLISAGDVFFPDK